MNRTDLDTLIYDALGGNITQFEAKDCCIAIIDFMRETLGEGERIEIRNFASFAPKYQKEMITRNPKTGEKFIKPAHMKIDFRPGLKVRIAVNQGNDMSSIRFRSLKDRYKNGRY